VEDYEHGLTWLQNYYEGVLWDEGGRVGRTEDINDYNRPKMHECTLTWIYELHFLLGSRVKLGGVVELYELFSHG
jgi:hypothetical protein